MKLGETQLDVLQQLVKHERWFSLCGWVWDTPYRTKKIMDRLVELGLAEMQPTLPYADSTTLSDYYMPTPLGIKTVKENRRGWLKKPRSQDALEAKLADLLKEGLQQASVLKVLGFVYSQAEMKPIVDKARQTYTMDSDCDIEIDASPLFSEAGDGTWVSAWVWVPKENEEEVCE